MPAGLENLGIDAFVKIPLSRIPMSLIIHYKLTTLRPSISLSSKKRDSIPLLPPWSRTVDRNAFVAEVGMTRLKKSSGRVQRFQSRIKGLARSRKVFFKSRAMHHGEVNCNRSSTLQYSRPNCAACRHIHETPVG